MMHTWLIRGVSTALLGCLGEAKMKAILMTTTSNTADMRQFFAAARSNGISYDLHKADLYCRGAFSISSMDHSSSTCVHLPETQYSQNFRRCAKHVIHQPTRHKGVNLHQIKYLLNTLVYISIASTNIISSLCRSITQIGSTSIYWLRVSTNPFRRVHTKTNPFRTCTCSIFFSS